MIAWYWMVLFFAVVPVLLTSIHGYINDVTPKDAPGLWTITILAYSSYFVFLAYAFGGLS